MKNVSAIIAITLILLPNCRIYAQDTTWSDVIFQIDQKSKFKEKIIVNDSTDLFVEYAFDSSHFNISSFPARVLGKNKSLIAISIPDSILENAQYIKVSSPGKVACVRCPASSDYVELMFYESKPFDYNFNSTPEGAELYLIPLYECRGIFNTDRFPKIELSPSVIPAISSYKISMRPTPVTYKVDEKPYVAIFVLQNEATPKMTKELIKPNRNSPELNKVLSIIR